MTTVNAIRKFVKRAETIKRKSEALMSDLMDAEPNAWENMQAMSPSDWVDNICHQSGELIQSLNAWIEMDV